MSTFLVTFQIILSILLTIVILLQQRGSGLGSLAGGSGDAIAFERRGGEKVIFQATIALAVLFTLNAALLPLFG